MADLMQPFWQGGPSPGLFYEYPGKWSSDIASPSDARNRTSQPTVTGTSVLGLKFTGGVIIAADTLGSYGSMARFRNVSRVMKVNDSTILSAAGDYADFQFIKAEIEQMVIDEEVLNDGFFMSPGAVHSWMTRMLYHRRSKFDPLWNSVTVAGFYNGESFLGSVDKIGIAFKSASVASGFGAYLAQPLMRKAIEDNGDNLSYEKARHVIEECLKVLYYRDARSYNRYELAVVTKDGVKIEKPSSSKPDWNVANVVRGFE
ncbi:proteasome subunit beta type-4-like [Ciona intestinalis]